MFAEIDTQLKQAQKSTFLAKQELQKARRFLTEDIQYGGDNPISAAQYIDELNRQGLGFKIYRNNLLKLELLQKSPYFGRIDFHDFEIGKTESIYIGVASLVESATSEHLVYDWRAPISSMFYDYGIGRAQYQAPMGIVAGEIILKRQYRIENGKIEYMFESDLTINDEILQAALSKSADNKMKHIIYTIQFEQNQAIRDEDTRVLLVHGPAGSGKTSIALHRAAYLLYRYREELNANNIMIFSPNRIFSDYIKNVLPELGEENIRQATMQEYISDQISLPWLVEDYYRQFEFILNDDRSDEYRMRLKAIDYKSSADFFSLIQKYLSYIEANKFQFTDLKIWDQMIISKQECEDLFNNTHGYLPIIERLDKMRRRINYMLDPIRKSQIAKIVKEKASQAQYKGYNERELQRLAISEVNRDVEPIQRKIDAMLANNVYQLYSDLFKLKANVREFVGELILPNNWEQICELTLANLKRKMLFFEDVAPFLYFQGQLSGWKELSDIKHVIIDEAQDYSLFHYEIFRNIFPKAALTILGDLNQAIHPYLRLTDFKTAASAFSRSGYDYKILSLTKSYRSTKEIADFTSRLLTSEQKIESVDRSGIKPQVVEFQSGLNQQVDQLTNTITDCLREGCESVAIICKTRNEVKQVTELLRNRVKFTAISHEIEFFPSGVVVIPVYLAKGLEFDAVIIYNATQENYGLESDRNLLYTACSRALHYLYVYYSEELSSFIADIDPSLYQISYQ